MGLHFNNKKTMVYLAVNKPLKNTALFYSLMGSLLCLTNTAYASQAIKDDIGYTELTTLLGGSTPDGSGVVVSQVEATQPDHWLADGSNSQLTGKTITNRAGATPTGFSSHATTVARDFSGADSISSGINQINAYETFGWLTSDFVNAGSSAKPDVPLSRIGNHSWIGAFQDAGANSNTLRRVDWLIETDEFLQIAGTSNSAGGSNPVLISAAFNVLSVGKTTGSGQSTTAIDSLYVAGRAAPHVVTPYSTTSSGTALVTSLSALLIEEAHSNTSLSNGSKTNRAGDTLYHAEYAAVIKAIIMAGADRETNNTSITTDITDYRLAPANQTSNGLDTRYGAGQINALNSYMILTAGEQDSQEDGNGVILSSNGFDYDSGFGGSNGTNSTGTYSLGTIPAQSELKIALVWNLDVDGGGRFSFNDSAILHNLDLQLIDVTAGNVVVAQSNSAAENTEHIHYTLEAGHEYLIRVLNGGGSNFNWGYALAWQTTEIPSDLDNDGIPDESDPDIDGDGIDNDWEDLYGLDSFDPSDALLDNDNDGRNNLTEFTDNGNPLVADTGDANGDLQLNAQDLLLLQRHLNGAITFNSQDLSRADQNSDGVLDLADLLLLEKLLQ